MLLLPKMNQNFVKGNIMLFKKKDNQTGSDNSIASTAEKPKKRHIFGKIIKPIGSKNNREFAKNLLIPKESRGFIKKVKGFFSEIKYRCQAPHKFTSYEDWERYMGIEGAEEKDVKKAIKLVFFHPTIIILAVLLGTIFFSDITWFNTIIYLSSIVFFAIVIPTYFQWNWIYKNKKYITLKNFLSGSR